MRFLLESPRRRRAGAAVPKNMTLFFLLDWHRLICNLPLSLPSRPSRKRPARLRQFVTRSPAYPPAYKPTRSISQTFIFDTRRNSCFLHRCLFANRKRWFNSCHYVRNAFARTVRAMTTGFQDFQLLQNARRSFDLQLGETGASWLQG